MENDNVKYKNIAGCHSEQSEESAVFNFEILR